MQEFAVNLKKTRRAKDLSRAKLAARSGVSYFTIRDLEYGQNRNPSHVTVVRLARALGVPPDELFPVPELDLTADEAPVVGGEPETGEAA